MGTDENGTVEDPRIAEIRRDIERARLRVAETIDALEYKADLSARLGDVLSTAASSVATRVLQRSPMTHSSREEAALKEAAPRSGPSG